MNKCIRTGIFAFIYGAALVIIGFIASRYPESATVIVFGVALISIVVALFFRTIDIFDKKYVDLIYYSIAALGVVMYFSAESGIRLVRAVDDRINAVERIIRDRKEDMVNFDNVTAELVELEAQREALVIRIKNDPDDILKAIHDVEINEANKSTTAEALTCARVAGFPRFIRPGRGNKFDNRANLRETVDPLFASQACSAYRDARMARVSLVRSQTLQLSELASQEDRFRLIRNQKIRVNGMFMSIGALIQLFSSTSHQNLRDDLRSKKLIELKKAKQLLSTLISNREPDKEQALNNVSQLIWWLRYYGWPYVLIWLLSLKLARYEV